MIPGIYFLLLLLISGIIFYWKKTQLKAIKKSLDKHVEQLLSGLDRIQHGNLNDETKLPDEFASIFQKIKQIRTDQEQVIQWEKKDFPEKYNELRKTIDNLYIVNELGRKVTSSLSLDQTFRHLYTTINSMMDAAVLELIVYETESGEKKFITNLEAGDSSYSNHIADWSHNNNREVFLTDAENDFGRYVFQPLILPGNIPVGAMMVFPIMNGSIVAGTLSVISRQKNSYSDYHRDIIRQLLGYISVAIENAMRHEELHTMKIRAERSEKFKEQFLANMSHEIRTPINAVTGMTHLLLEKHPRPDQVRYLESIRNASDALLVIINDILDLSKIEAGKIELEQIGFSIDEVVGNVKEIMQFKAEEKGLIFEVLRDQHIPPVVVGDPTRLSQILINLVGNAIKFTEKGSVAIRVLHQDHDHGDNSDRIAVRFEVEDTGIGMTQDQQAKLFRDYTQASPETTRKYGGTGLGLSISKQLVSMQGGDIGVESREDKGTTFFFTLTFAASNLHDVPAREQGISNEMLEQLSGMRLLLADDNEYNRIVVRDMLSLRIRNIHIDEAQDGHEAIRLLRNNDYDLVLMDLVMPRLDGLEATTIIRNELPDPKNKVPVIALTASVVKSEIEKCYAAGMNGFIPKPFKTIELFGPVFKTMAGLDQVTFSTPVKQNNSRKAGSIVDREVLDEHAEGDEVRKKRFMELFIEKAPAGLASITSAMESKDYVSVRVSVHSMKPLLLFTGVTMGVDLVEKIEMSCLEKKDTELLPAMISELKEVCLKAMVEVREMMGQGITDSRS